jgi:hypothetical protein
VPPAEPKEETPPAAGPSPLQEFMEDVTWNLFRKNPAIGMGLVFAVAALVVLALWYWSPGHQADHAADVLTVTAGTVDVKSGSEGFTNASAVTTPGATVTATTHGVPTVVSFGHHSRIRLEEHTTFVFQEWANNQLKIKLLEGHAWVEPGDGESAEVSAADGFVDCPPDSSAEFTVGPGASGETHQPQVKATQGTLQVRTTGGASSALPAGYSTSLPDASQSSSSPCSNSSPCGSGTTHF